MGAWLARLHDIDQKKGEIAGCVGETFVPSQVRELRRLEAEASSVITELISAPIATARDAADALEAAVHRLDEECPEASAVRAICGNVIEFLSKLAPLCLCCSTLC